MLMKGVHPNSVGKVEAYMPYVGYVTIVMNDYREHFHCLRKSLSYLTSYFHSKPQVCAAGSHGRRNFVVSPLACA